MALQGNLRGKIVLAGPMREVMAHFDVQGKRLTEKELLRLADAGDRVPLALRLNLRIRAFRNS